MNHFKLPGYQVTHPPIGEGCTGSVYLAHTHTEPSNKLVAKNYQSFAIDRDQLKRNFDKFGDMPKIEGIATPVDWQFDCAPYYSVVELLPGNTLDTRPILKEKQAWLVIQQLVNALGHAHKYGVVHGNLHPGNIHFTENNNQINIQVTDFGAGLLGENHHIKLFNNVFFLAPEQLSTRGRNFSVSKAKKWDAYSFGIIAYWLLTDHLPRGENDLVSRVENQLDHHPVDLEPIAESIHNDAFRNWERHIGNGGKESVWLQLINQCLEQDPAKRPVDMREVKNLFLEIENQFELEQRESNIQASISDLKSKHLLEFKEQRSKLFAARVATTVLALSCLGAAYLVVMFVSKAIDSKSKIHNLDMVVENQQESLTELDRNINETSHFLKQSQALADDAFYKVTQQLDTSLTLTELKNSANYYTHVLQETENKPNQIKEYGRALHSLAHIENLLSKKNSAIINFELAIDAFKSVSEPTSDIIFRIADCYEYVGLLSDETSTKAGFESTAKSIEYFTKALALRPNDKEVALRLATTSYRYGRYLYENSEFDEAIHAYSKSAAAIASHRDQGNYTGDTTNLNTVVASLQFHAAEAMKEEGLDDDAVNSYIAAIESSEKLGSIDGYGRKISILMARSYTSLGDIFNQNTNINHTARDQLYNEALRLISPIMLALPNDFEIATLYCRIVTNLADLEVQSGNKKDGYQLSLRGIETLIAALEKSPNHLPGYLQLAESRLVHIKFLNSDKKFARKIALRGLDTAKHAHNLVAESNADQDYQYRARTYNQLRKIFDGYGSTLKKLGESKTASECFEYASHQFTSR